MNLFRQTPQSYFCFDEAASGTGTVAPTTTPAPTAPSSAPVATPSTPPSAPTTVTPSGREVAPGTDSDPFSGLDGSFDDQDEIEIIAAPPTDGGTAIPAAPAPAAPAPAAAPVAPAPASPTEPVAPAPVAASAPTAPASPRAALDEAIEGFKANNKELAAHAAGTLFKLSDEDATALATNAEEVIPRLMGQVYTHAIAAAGNLIRNFVPQIIDHQMQQSQTRTAKSQEAVNAFYSANPDLNQQTHGEAVTKWARSFRQANPTATRQQAMEFVSRAVRIETGLAAPAPGTAPAAPVAFAPARPGGRPPQAPGGEKDPYSGLGMDFED